jgi:hypothetical protein
MPNKPRKPKSSSCVPRSCPASACGRVPDGCGGTLTCAVCTGNRLCVDGTCRDCDVCQPSGACEFASVQAAIEATPPRDGIVICPGTYAENDQSFYATVINNLNVRLIGAGAGDLMSNTILTPEPSNKVVLGLFSSLSAIEVEIE